MSWLTSARFLFLFAMTNSFSFKIAERYVASMCLPAWACVLDVLINVFLKFIPSEAASVLKVFFPKKKHSILPRDK